MTPESLLKTSEDSHQAALFAWAALEANGRFPQLKLLYAIPNGGKRDLREAAKLKATGTRSGVPDICLPCPSGSFHGLYLELKVGKNRTSPEQDKWIERLRSAGYCVRVAYGYYEARDAILSYLTQLEMFSK